MVFVLFSGSINFPSFMPLVMFTCQRVCVSEREVSVYIVLSVRYWSSNLLGQYFGSTFVHDGSSSQISPLQYIEPYELLEDERISQIAPRVKWSASLPHNLQTPNTGFSQLVSCPLVYSLSINLKLINNLVFFLFLSPISMIACDAVLVNALEQCRVTFSWTMVLICSNFPLEVSLWTTYTK